MLKKDFGVDINVERVSVTPFGTVKLNGVFIRDHHQDTLAYIKRLNTSILSFSKLYQKGHPFFGDVQMDELNFKIHQYKGEKDTNLDRFVAAFDDGKPSSGRFRLKANTIFLNNSRFRYIDDNLKNPKVIDFTKLNGQLDDFYIKGANVSAYAYQLNFKDHRGVEMKNLTTDFLYTKKNILLNELVLETSKSSFKGKVELRYNRDNHDFSDFNNKVLFDIDIKEGKFNTDDINSFYPEFGKNQKFYVDSYIKGTLNDLKFTNLKMFDSNNEEVVGNLHFKNLFGKGNQEFYMNGKFDRLKASHKSLCKLLPNLLGKNLPNELIRLGEVDLNGKVEVTEKWLNADVDLFSTLGHVVADFELNHLDKIEQADYVGNFKLDNFNLGAFIADKTFGKTTLTTYIDGKGFNRKYLNTLIDGQVKSFNYKGYNYQNIKVDGLMKMPYFKGIFVANDPNLKLKFNGLVDLSKKKKEYDFEANITYADLRKTKLYKKDLISIISGDIKFNAKGNTLDDLAGKLELNNVKYKNQKGDYQFQNAFVESVFDYQGIRTINFVSSDLIEGKIVGKYKVKQIKPIVENAFGSLYANYSPHKLLKNQFIDFNFVIHNRIFELFYPNVSVSENTSVKGKINGDTNLFQFDVSSPLVDLFGNKLNNVKVDIDNKNPLYNAYIQLDSINTDLYTVRDFQLINVTHSDTLFVRSEFKGGPKGKDTYDLNLFHTINENKESVIGFKKSDITFKNYQWYINEKDSRDNTIVFDKKFKDFNFNKLTLSHNEQFIDFKGVIKDSTYKDLNLTFNEVDISKITPELEDISLGGLLNGEINYKQDKNIYTPTTDLKVKNFSFNDINLGDLDAKISSDENFRKFNVNSNLIFEDDVKFNTTGIVEFINKKPILELDATFHNFNVAPIGGFLKGIVENVRGEATGKATIIGRLDDPEINGALYLNNAGLKIPYLNVDYNFDKNSIIDVTESKFIFKNIEVADVNENSKGILSGKITHDKLSNWDLDLRISTDKLLVLDTQDSEDAYYYGKAYFDGYGTIQGPVNALEIKAIGQSVEGTSIKIPVNESESVGDNSYVHFVTPDEKFGKTKKEIQTKTYKGIDLNFIFDINKNAEIEVILNRETGHSMKGRGMGSLDMNINTLGKFEMVGDFHVLDGKYYFKYGNIINKTFDVKPGGTIRWDGDPFGAILDLEAVYNTTANPGMLVESASFNRKVPTEVIIGITGDLAHPQSDFNINFPNVQSSLKSEIDYKLQDKDFRQRQAFGLLGTGSFVSPDNTAWYGSFLETAKGLFGEILSDGENKMNVGVDYQIGDRQRDISDRALVTLTTQINDKLSINGNVGVPVGGVNQSYIVGNVEVELKLNEEGTLTAHVFNKENDVNYFTVGQNQGYTQGIGLSYSVDFDDFNELLHKLFKSQKDKNNNSNIPVDQLPDSEISIELQKFIEESKKKHNKSDKPKNNQPIVPEIE